MAAALRVRRVTDCACTSAWEVCSIGAVNLLPAAISEVCDWSEVFMVHVTPDLGRKPWRTTTRCGSRIRTYFNFSRPGPQHVSIQLLLPRRSRSLIHPRWKMSSCARIEPSLPSANQEAVHASQSFMRSPRSAESHYARLSRVENRDGPNRPPSR